MGSAKSCVGYPCWGRASPRDALFCKEGSKTYESFGFVIHAWARAPSAFVISAFFNPYITTLAAFVAASSSSDKVNWLGINLSAGSYVSTYTTIYSVLAALAAPILGTVAGSTPHRRKFLVLYSCACAIVNILALAVVFKVWWLGGLIGIAVLFFYESSLVFLYAYIPDLGETDQERSKASTQSILSSNFSQIFIAVVGIGLSLALASSSPSLRNPSFEDFADVSWQIGPGATSSNPLLSPSFSSCLVNNTICFPVLDSSAPDRKSVLRLLANNPAVSVFQNSSFETSSSLELLFEARARARSASAKTASLRIWIEGQPMRESAVFKLTQNEFSFLVFRIQIEPKLRINAFEVHVLETDGTSSVQVDLDDVGLSVIPSYASPILMMLAGVWFLFFGTMAFSNLGARGPSSSIRVQTWGQLFSVPIKKLHKTLQDSIKTPEFLFWIIGYAFYAAGATAVAAVAGVVFSQELGLPSYLIGIVLLYAQLIGILGACAFHFLGVRFGCQTALLTAYVLFTFSLVYAFLFLKGVGANIHVWITASLIGVALGACVALSRVAFARLIPRGKEAEYFGIFNFANKILAFMGPLLFTVFNEAFASVRLAFLSMGILFLVSVFFQILCILNLKRKSLSVARVSFDETETQILRERPPAIPSLVNGD